MQVVSYSISTSNHNPAYVNATNTRVVSYSISTSNHNHRVRWQTASRLYLIPFLHQTTTYGGGQLDRLRCILFHFYIKPQLFFYFYGLEPRCILFHFYIKPQPCFMRMGNPAVVSYSISTSNHNSFLACSSCSSVVSYSISTSNHNESGVIS